jgi:hypothetical protein
MLFAICNKCFNIKKNITFPPPQCIYIFHMILRKTKIMNETNVSFNHIRRQVFAEAQQAGQVDVQAGKGHVS